MTKESKINLFKEEILRYENELKEMKNQIKDYYSSDLERRIKIKQKTIDYRKKRIMELKEEL